MKPKPPKSVAERKADERERMAALGFKRREFYVHPDDWERVQRYLRLVNRKREG